MSKETLKSLRILIPGIIVFFLTIPAFNPQIKPTELLTTVTLLEGSIYTALAFILGTGYYLTNLRGYFLKNSLNQIHKNIKSKLLEPFKDNFAIYKHKDKLEKGKTLIECFYGLIDNNESLKEKAKNVHLNGLIWSTVADISALSFLASILHLLLWLFTITNSHLLWSLSFALIYIVFSRVMMNQVTILHIEKSDEQLDFIKLYLKNDLQKKIEQAIKSLGAN